MKKFLASIATVAMAFSAGAADWTYTVDPAEGEVTMLQFVTVTFPTIEEIDINQKDDITVTRDGVNVRGVDISTDENQLQFVFGAEQTDPATYLITIPAYALAGYADGYAWMEDNEEDIVLKYVIASQGSTGLNWEYQVNPEAGEVTEISEIQLYFPNIEEVEINSKDDIVLSFNGAPVSGVKSKIVDDQIVSITPSETLTQAGTYTLSIPAYTLSGYDYANDIYGDDYTDDIDLTWTIVGSSQGDELSFEYTPSLATDEYYAFFQEVTLEFTEVESVTYSGTGLTVNKDGEPLDDVTVKTDANKLTVTLKDALNMMDAAIDIVIAPEALTATADGVTASNTDEIKVSYTMATPVEYDLTLAISTPKPNAAGQISAEKSLSNIFFVCEEKGLVAASGSGANVTIESEEGDFKATGRLRKANGLNANYSYFSVDFGSEPRYNGNYTITIDRTAFGTEVWSKDPNYGHSNAEITLNFELVDGADRKVYNIEPTSIDPEEGIYEKGEKIATITLTFPEGVTAIEGASATLAGVDNTYRETAAFTLVDGAYSVTFDSAPTEEGKYIFTVVEGQFGNAGFISNGVGKANAAISVSYEIKFESGVDSVEAVANDSNEIYTLQGIRVDSANKKLPAGIYIVNGKKMVIK